jgi:hypothetical protein
MSDIHLLHSDSQTKSEKGDGCFSFIRNNMNYLTGIVFLLVANELEKVASYVSKGTVESIVPSKNVLQRPILRSAKISRLFSVKQLNSTMWNSTQVPIMEAPVPTTFEPKPEALVQDVSPRSVGLDKKLSSRFHENSSLQTFIYNRSSNPLISSESWKDLNTVLSEENMKGFLTTLPLHTLRSLTSLTRKNPELGQKQLMRLIIDRSHRLKLKPPTIVNVTETDIKPEVQSNSIPTTVKYFKLFVYKLM